MDKKWRKARQQQTVILIDALSTLKNQIHQKKYNIKCLMSSRNTSTFGPLAIRQQFLNVSSYQHTKSHNNKLNLLYDELCDIFISYYSTIQEKKSLKKQGSANSNSSNIQHFGFIKQLQSFNNQFDLIMMEISTFQIGCLQNLKMNNRPVFDNLNQLSAAVRENKQLQRDIVTIIKKIEPIFKQIKINFNSYKKGDENPQCYYDRIYSQNANKGLIEKINDGSILAKQIYQKKQIVQQKITQFDSILMKFKCKLIQNKYSVRKAIFNFTEKMKYSLVEMIELFKECTASHKMDFLKVLEDKDDDIVDLQGQLRVESRNEDPVSQSYRWQKAIQKSIGIYLQEVQLVEQIIDGLCVIFRKSQQMHQIKKNKFKEIIQKICSYYAPVETPRQQMQQLFSISDNLRKKFSIILQRLSFIRDTIIKNKIHTQKHSQIIISLIKMKIKNNQSFFDKRNKRQLEQLIKQLSFSQIKGYILSFYQCCILNQSQLQEVLISTGRPRRKTLDSMQISHSNIYKKYSVDRKKPLAEQLWLWRDFRQESNPVQKQYLQYFDKISAYIQKSNDRFKIKNDIQLEKYPCSLGKRNIIGQLILKGTKLEFISKNIHLNIEWKQILNIQQESNFFNKEIKIITSQGQILFTNFQTEINSIVSSIKQIQEKPKINSETLLIHKKEIILSAQQIKYIQERKEKIQINLPKLDTFKLIVEQTFLGERIDEIYQLIYSDKPFDFYGRQQPCFFSYTGKKGGNFNWVAEKYDRPGPQFYTLQEGINFQNCPIFSHRKITYNHPMKPSAIPFMPKKSKNEDNRYIYWISHEEFIYQIKSTVFQVPFADNFYVELAHKVSKVDNGVKIQIYSKIVFVKDTSFKSAIFNSTDPEIDENMIGFMGQIRKLLKLRQQAAKGVKIPVQVNIPTEKNPQTQKTVNQVQKLKLYNKILIGVLIFFIMTNILHYI